MYIYIYVHMYVYYMILLYLEGSVSKLHSVNTKTSQFSPIFWIPGVEEKTCQHQNQSIFPFFGFQELGKNMCIYIYISLCIYVNYFQPFPHILWVAQLPMGFRWDFMQLLEHQWMHAMQCLPTKHLFCVLFQLPISVRQGIYVYICMSIQTLFKEDIVFRGTFKFPDLYSGICQWFQVSIFPNAPYIYIYIYSYIIYSKQFPKIIMGFNH